MYCSECGKEFVAHDRRVRYCPECKELKKNKTTRTCVVCGVELSGNSRKYCTQCSKDVKLKQIQRAMDKKHHIAINKSVYDDFKKYFKREDKFNDIVKYIDDHIGEELSLKTVADKFFITESYLSHFFKRRAGKSVIQYLNEARVIKAKLYLEQYNIPIGEIAGLVGFDDINYFSRKFRQICGETPTQYRSSCRE